MAKHSRLEVLGEVIRQGLVPLAYVPDVETMKKLVTARPPSTVLEWPGGQARRKARLDPGARC